MYQVIWKRKGGKFEIAFFMDQDELLRNMNIGLLFEGIQFPRTVDQFYVEHFSKFSPETFPAGTGMIFYVDIVIPFPKVVKEWSIFVDKH